MTKTVLQEGLQLEDHHHVYAVENPHIVKRTHSQHIFSLNDWAGVVSRWNAYYFFFDII